MLNLINLIEKSLPSVESDFLGWFNTVPTGAAWRVISDYSLDNSSKQNDAYTFVILLNHDTSENIASYINSVAPVDMKGTRNPSTGLIKYLACPVAFSLTFVVERNSDHLKAFITPEAMLDHTAGMLSTVTQKQIDEPENTNYYSSLDKRLNALQRELRGKRANLKLLRKMFLAGTFASVVFRLLERKRPTSIFWITDRDAIFDRHDGIAFDVAWILFQVSRLDLAPVVHLSRPKFRFASPGMDGVTEYAEFVRLPDYLAGVFADIQLPQLTFSHGKFEPIFEKLIINSTNNTVIELLTSVRSGHVTARRLRFTNQ